MAPNRIMRGGATLVMPLLLLALLAGCGGGGSSTAVGVKAGGAAARAKSGAGATPGAAPTQAADTDLLNNILGRQQAAVRAYGPVIRALPPHLARMATYFRRQEQEHVDGVQKAMWGLSIEPRPGDETIDPGDLASAREALEFLYEMESVTIEKELTTLSKLEARWARALLASTVANQAQHLALLREALGARGLRTIPAPFENGRVPAPE